MADRQERHLSEEAIFDLLDGALTPEVRRKAERHLRGCPDCVQSVRRARSLFSCLEEAAEPSLDRDLAPEILARLRAKQAGSGALSRMLAAEAVLAIAALAAFGLQIGRGIEALQASPAYVALREHALQLAAELVSWGAPILHLMPSFPARLTSIRIEVPHLGGPLLGWVGLAAAALALGVVGNALLLRSPHGPAPDTVGTRRGSDHASQTVRRGQR